MARLGPLLDRLLCHAEGYVWHIFPGTRTESLDKTCTRYNMDLSAEKTKLMTNNANGIQREIKVKEQKLGTLTSFKYLEAVVSDDGSKPEVLSRIA